MIAKLLTIYQEGKDKLPPATEHCCKYCNKSFKRPETLTHHMCERKRRYLQESEYPVRVAMMAFTKFNEYAITTSKPKTYDDFVDSNFYAAFVKFGRYIADIRAVNPMAFIDFVIRQNKKIDKWGTEATYTEYLAQCIKRENAQDAVERSIIEIQLAVDEGMCASISDYFRNSSPNRIVNHIINGRISPWVIYNCDSGIAMLESMNEEQLKQVMPWITPLYWTKKLNDNASDVTWIKEILLASGL